MLHNPNDNTGLCHSNNVLPLPLPLPLIIIGVLSFEEFQAVVERMPLARPDFRARANDSPNDSPNPNITLARS